MGFSLPLQTKTTLTMITLKELYRIGYGPSSSHTMAPRKAATLFLERNPKAVRFEVTLYGSLAATGKGHMTDKAYWTNHALQSFGNLRLSFPTIRTA